MRRGFRTPIYPQNRINLVARGLFREAPRVRGHGPNRADCKNDFGLEFTANAAHTSDVAHCRNGPLPLGLELQEERPRAQSPRPHNGSSYLPILPTARCMLQSACAGSRGWIQCDDVSWFQAPTCAGPSQGPCHVSSGTADAVLAAWSIDCDQPNRCCY